MSIPSGKGWLVFTSANSGIVEKVATKQLELDSLKCLISDIVR